MNKIFLLALLAISILSDAQPTDAQIKKDVGGNEPKIKSFQFTKTTGTRQWNSSFGNYEYVRGVLVVKESSTPGIDVEIRGDAVYQYMGDGKYNYWKFRVISNQFIGIPNPTFAEVKAIIASNWKLFYRADMLRIYKIWEPLRFADEPGFYWYTPNSVECLLKTKISLVESNIETKMVDMLYKVRLYRDSPTGAWKNFVSSRETTHKEYREISKETITAEQATALRKQAIGYQTLD